MITRDKFRMVPEQVEELNRTKGVQMTQIHVDDVILTGVRPQ